QERVPLQHRLKLDRPYDLVNGEHLAEFRKSLGGYASLTLFSQVYFNPSQTAAFVYAVRVCETPCANSWGIYLENREGEWIRGSSSLTAPADTYAIYSLLLHDDPYPGL